jgi:hypothetical protein
MSALLLPGRGKLGSMHRTYGEACTFLGRLKAISFPLVSPMIPHTRDSVTWFSRLGPGFWVSNLNAGNQQGVSYSPWFRCVSSLLPYLFYVLFSLLSCLHPCFICLSCFSLFPTVRPYHITSPLPSLVTSFLTTLAGLFSSLSYLHTLSSSSAMGAHVQVSFFGHKSSGEGGRSTRAGWFKRL